MDPQEFSYEQALLSDKNAVRAIVAPTGPVDRIVEFPQLRSLDLSGNRSIKRFDFLSQLAGLEKLYLADLELSEIPPQVASLQQLKTLFIGKNPIKDFALLAKLPELEDLGIEEMGLKKLPEQVLALKGLKVLGAYGNSITTIASLKKLPNLEQLFIADNQLTKIPKELKSLSRLRKLDLLNNYAITDEGVVGELQALEELSMGNSHKIGLLPRGIFGLRKLRTLKLVIHSRMDHDDLGGLAAIHKLENLESLTIHGAALTALPETFSQLKKLKKLDLKDNEKLVDVDALRDLPALEELNLACCPITRLGASFGTLKGLAKVDLSYNEPLEDISGLRDLPALHELKLYTELKALPDGLGTLTQLKTLSLRSEGAGIGFLKHLKGLQDLELVECACGELAADLPHLRKLRIDAEPCELTLPSYPALENLEVFAASFTLPLLPQLQSLSVGRIAKALDLACIAALPRLETLAIHRSASLQRLPQVVGSATGLKRVTLEFMKALTDISALEGLFQLSHLELSYLDQLEALPGSFKTLTSLEQLEISDAKHLIDVEALGGLTALRELKLDDLQRLAALPPSLKNLGQLRRLVLNDLPSLSDISMVEQLPKLEALEVDDCDGLPRKSIAALKNAIAARANPTALAMSYERFIASGHYKSLNAKEDQARSYSFPLWFDQASVLLEAMEDFSWLDDHRDNEGSEEWAILNDEDSALKPLALLDLGFEGCNTERIDAYCEEVFLVDTADAQNPVFIWGHDGAPTKLHDSFDHFIASLRDFTLADASEDGTEEAEADSQRTYLEFVEGSSAKFWQVVVTGHLFTGGVAKGRSA